MSTLEGSLLDLLEQHSGLGTVPQWISAIAAVTALILAVLSARWAATQWRIQYLTEEWGKTLDSSCRTRYYRSSSRQLARRVDISYVTPKAVPELSRKLENLSERTNVWGLVLGGVTDNMRVQRYGRNDYTDTHSDYDYGTCDFSKLTIVIPLVDPSGWEGGELQVGNSLRSPRLKLGDAVVFPSFSPHRVTRIKKGERCFVGLGVWTPAQISPPSQRLHRKARGLSRNNLGNLIPAGPTGRQSPAQGF